MGTMAVITSGLALLSFVSGMLGLGVAFAAIPFLGLFLPDLVHQVQPLSLLLNGVTALFSVFGFAAGGHIVWKKAFLLGVGPGFLLLPTLMIAGYNTKKAAGINALAVTPPSFSALIPHAGTAQIDPTLAGVLLVAGAAASFAGARVTSRFVPSARVKQIFGVLIVVMTAYKIWTLLR